MGAMLACLLRISCRRQLFRAKHRRGSVVAVSFTDQLSQATNFAQSTVGVITLSFTNQLPQATILRKVPSGERYRFVFYESVAAGNHLAVKHRRGSIATLSFTNQLPQATIRKRQLLRKDVSFSLARRPYDGQLPLFC